MQISPSRSLGNWGGVWPPARLMKSEGIRTLVRKLRLCQSARGRKRTRVERFVAAPSRDVWRTIFRRLLLEKRIGTSVQAYKLAPAKQNLTWRRAIGRVTKRNGQLLCRLHGVSPHRSNAELKATYLPLQHSLDYNMVDCG